MRSIERLLAFASRWFDPDTIANVFEPLIADWQREWHDRPASIWGGARILVGGAGALALSIAQCLLTGGLRMPRIALVKGAAVLILSTALLVLIQIGLNTQQFEADFPFEMRIWMALPLVLPLAVPLAMLPVMMLIRGAGRTSTRAAAVVMFAGALLTLVTTGWLTPLARADVRASLFEEIELRAVANEQAGRYSYPSTAARQVRNETPEQRAQRRQAWHSSPLYVASQANMTRPRWNRSTFMMAALGVALGALGWALGGLGRTKMIHAAGWWSLAWLAMMILDNRMQYWVNGGVLRLARAPDWLPLVVFGLAAIALQIAPARKHQHEGTGTLGTHP